MSRAPVAPSGCPSAIAPPVDVDARRIGAQRPLPGDHHRRKCLVDLDQVDVCEPEPRLRERVFASPGSVRSASRPDRPPRTDRWWMRARGFRPCRRTAASLAISSAAAPSAIWLDTAAVTRPPGVSGSSVAIFSSVVPRAASRRDATSPTARSRDRSSPRRSPGSPGDCSRARTPPCSRRLMFHFSAIISAERNCETSWSP